MRGVLIVLVRLIHLFIFRGAMMTDSASHRSADNRMMSSHVP